VAAPTRGEDFPGSYGEMRAWFPDDAACLDYLDWLRWRRSFSCPHCSSAASWRLPDGRRSCGGCGRRVSATAGTVFHHTRTPMTVWFAAAWHITSQKGGVSALGLQRVLGIGSYQTAWTMLHRYRTAMVRPGRERLSGTVEVDETFVGGPRSGKPGRGAAGKVIVLVAVEQHQPKGFGRCRLVVIPNVRSPALRAALLANIEPGSTIVSDGYGSYPGAILTDYTHAPINVSASGVQAHIVLPGVHRVASLVKRWLLGTLHGAVEADHIQAYLDEFAFRFNRRNSATRGMLFYRLLEQAVATGPTTYDALVANPKPKRKTPTPPAVRRQQPASLAQAALDRPWRQEQAS
jgi:transposase-like protein